ncbi:SpaA isopeptide-forming pilin-related protein [Microbacterium sp. AZCO]|uniref:SpaA isopeptide-forming pilin-related protein n=1 Tax=Microbacterium sp. AZCO TaxID=3142976 RepID=UPI0031F39888
MTPASAYADETTPSDTTATDTTTDASTPAPTDPATPTDPAAPSAPTAPSAPVATPEATPSPTPTTPAKDTSKNSTQTVKQDAATAPLAVDTSAALLAASCASPFGGFEIDGDYAPGTCGGIDWGSGVGTSTATVGTYQVVKDNSDPSTWTSTGGTPPKVDFIRVYTYSHIVGGQYYLYVGWDREHTSGTGGYAIEVTNAGTSVGADGTPRPNRTNGGAVFYITTQGSAPPILLQSCVYTNAGNYPGTCSSGTGGFIGAVSTADLTNPAGEAVEAGGFFEIGMNVTALTNGQVTPGCPGAAAATAYMRSFTGNNFGPTGNLKGWVGPAQVVAPSTCGSLTIEKKNEAGAYLAGAQFTVTPNPTTGAGSASVTTDATGKIVFSANVKPGTYTVTETVAPPGYVLPSPNTQTVTIGSLESKTLTFVDPLGSVTWLKKDDVGNLLGGATFQVAATGGAAAAAPWAASFPKTVVDNGANDADPVAGQFKLTGLPLGSYTVKETAAPAGYVLDSTTKSFDITNALYNVSITGAFVNIPYATITLTKHWVSPFTGDTAQLSIGGAATKTGTSTAPTDGPVISVSVAPGSSLTLAEVLGAQNTGLYTSSLSCVGATVSGNTGTGGSITVPAYPASKAGVQCTFTNTAVQKTITVKKKWVDAVVGDKAVVHAGANQNTSTATQANLDDAAHVATITVRVGDTVNLGESLAGNVGTYGSAYSCTDQAGTNGTALSFDYKVPNQDVTCTFTNTGQRATVKLQKNWVGAFAGDQAHLAIAGPATDADTSVASGVDGVDDTFSQVSVHVGEKVTLSESIVDAENTGRYTSTWSCDNGTSGTGRSIPQLTVTASITCTITNTAKTINVSVGKVWKNAFQGDSASLSVNGQSATTTADGSATQTVPGVVVKKVRVGEQVTVAEVLGQNNVGTYTTAIDCTNVSETVTGRTASFDAPDGADIVCTYTNEAVTHQVTLVKKWVNAIQGDKATITLNGTSSESTADGSASFTDTPKAVTVTVRQGAQIPLSEVLPGTNAGTYGSVLTCTPGASFTGSDRSHTLTVPSFDVTCTYTNTANTVTVSLTKHWVDAFPTDVTGLNITRGAQTLTTGISTAGDTPDKTISAVVRIGDKVVLSEALGSTNIGSYDTTWACTGGTAPTAGQLATGELTIAAGGISCTVTNTAKKVTVTVDKVWVNAFVGDDAVITVNGTSNTAVATSSNATNAAVVTKVVRIGDNVAISESLTSNTGVYDAKWKCGPNGVYADGGSTSFTATTNVTCTIQNTAHERVVKLQKQWVDAISGDTASLSIAGGAPVVSTANGVKGSQVDGTHVATASVRIGEVISLGEVLDAKSGSQYSSSYSCTPGGVVAGGAGRSFSLTVASGEGDILCTFTNANTQGKITLEKTVVNDNGGKALDTAWTLNAAGIVTASGKEGDAAVTGAFVPAGVYSLTETNGPAGYTQTGLDCTGGTFTPAAGGQPAKVAVDAASTVVCTFTNNDVAPTLKLVKNVDNTGGGVSGATAWTLTAAGPTAWNGTTAGSAAQASTSAQSVNANAAYALSESGPAGYTAGTWSCDTQGVLQGSTVTLPLAANVSCQITNTAIPATGTIDKTVTSISQNASGVWEIVYAITVTNTSVASTLTYDLADTLKFGAGAQGMDASWSGPAPASTPTSFNTSTWSAQIASGATLPQDGTGHATHVYTVTAHATIATFPTAQDTWQDCTLQDGEKGTGFLNSATLTVNGKSSDDTACDQPEFPHVVKTASNPVQGADGNWTVTYTIDVTTTGAAGDPAVYTVVKDALPGAPADWSLVGGAWHVVSGANTPTLSADFGPGDAQLFAGLIPAGSHYTYTVTGVLDPTAAASSIDCASEDGGLLNRAVVASGAATDQSEVCVSTDLPPVDVNKDALSVSENADGTWLVRYLVSVTNHDASRVAVYDLTDAPLFGAGITGTPSWAVSNSSGVAQGPFSTGTPLADDKTLAPLGVDHYVVQVNATIPASAWTAGQGTVLGLPCPTGEARSGGLLNEAIAVAGGITDTDTACTQPGLPTVVKTPQSALQQADPSVWKVSYLITVTPHGTDTFYDLNDVPGFASGVNVVSGTAQRVDTDPDGAVVPNIPSNGDPFVTGVALGGSDAPHQWLVTWTVRIPAQIPPATRDCGETPTAGNGFFNEAVLTVSGVDQNSDTCIPVKEKVYPDVTKTVTGLTRDPDTKVWEITYKIDVTLAANPDNLSGEYNLVEELEFGNIEVQDASWSGHRTGSFTAGATPGSVQPATLANNEPIASGGTHTYNVVVHATLEPGDLVNHTAGCDTQTRSTEVGFFNKVTLSSDDATPIVREVCTPPVYPSVTKSAPNLTTAPSGKQRLEYLITVTSPDPAAGNPVTNVIYRLEEHPDALPAGVAPAGDWQVEAVGSDTPTPTQSSFNGTGTWLIRALGVFSAADRTAGHLTHTFRVWRDVTVTSVPDSDELRPCAEGSQGIPVWNTVVLSSGEFVKNAEACDELQFDDVSIEKTGVLPEGEDNVEPGDTFDYQLTVTNHGTRAASMVHVFDDSLSVAPYADRIAFNSVTVDPNTLKVVDDESDLFNNIVDFKLETLGAGETATITIEAEFFAPPDTDATDLEQLPDPISSLVNTACVETLLDPIDGASGGNNCDDETIPVHDMTAAVYVSCVSDTAQLTFLVKTSGALANQPVTGTWVTDEEPTVEGHTVNVAPFFAGVTGYQQTIPWPGAKFTADGVAIDYPGWRPLRASDYTPDGQYIDPADGLPMTADEIPAKVYNGLILDNAEPDYAWRGASTITFEVNPVIAFDVEYPGPELGCVQARHSNVEIDKNASVANTAPGNSFDYTLAVKNVTDDSAADGVVVTDAIPTDLKITNVTWTGKGDTSVFPNWKDCAVAGQNGAGYGGTLTCHLFGPLQPGQSAPTITLAAYVNPSSTATKIDNVGVVEYHTFDDASDTGRDADSATVLLTPLAITGGTLGIWALWAGLAAVLGGFTLLYVNRRRRKTAGSSAE